MCIIYYYDIKLGTCFIILKRHNDRDVGVIEENICADGGQLEDEDL